MLFFKEPKIKRIARHLQSQLAELHHARRTAKLIVEARIEAKKGVTSEADEGSKTSSWFRKKEDFSWASVSNDGIPKYQLENAIDQTKHYKDLLDKADNIIEELNKTPPDYKRIKALADAIRDKSIRVPCVMGSFDIDIQIGYFTGGHLILDLFIGIVGLIYAPMIGLAGLCLSPFYLAGKSEYCGSPTFFLDTMQYFGDSLLKILCCAIVPLAMLRSKYETDSYNVFKGELRRGIDSIISLANEEMHDEASSSNELNNDLQRID